MTKEEAIKKINSWDFLDVEERQILETVIPELKDSKESEDERIRKNCIHFLELQKSHHASTVEIDKCIAWLEKQGEQKFTNKIEPKFKVGDWIVYGNEDVDHITGIEEKGYKINEWGYIPFVCEDDMRLWTIQGAKDGDVLYDNYTNTVLIFKSQTCGWIKVYCDFWINKNKFTGTNSVDYGRVSEMDLKPATKEQRELLFQKMKEAGYEWDANKKELKKIEQSISITWSEEDEILLDSAINLVNSTKHIITTDWLKSLKERLKQL